MASKSERGLLRAMALKKDQLEREIQQLAKELNDAKESQQSLERQVAVIEEQRLMAGTASHQGAMSFHVRAAWMQKLDSLVLGGRAAIAQAKMQVAGVEQVFKAKSLEKFKFERLGLRLEERIEKVAAKREQKVFDEMATNVFMLSRRQIAAEGVAA